MTDLQIRAAAERLKIETDLGEAQRKLEAAQRQIEFLKIALTKLIMFPEDYFETEDKIKQLFNSQP